MALEQDVKKALIDAGTTLKKDLWKPEDLKMLSARARDLVGLQLKAEAATTRAKKAQYRGAAKMVVEHVKLMALIRMEVAQQHVIDALGKFFLEKVLPVLVKLLPALFALI